RSKRPASGAPPGPPRVRLPPRAECYPLCSDQEFRRQRRPAWRTRTITEPGSSRALVAPSEKPSSLLSLLRRRYFRRLWAVTTVSSLGDWLGVFALVLFVQDLSGRQSSGQPEFAVG